MAGYSQYLLTAHLARVPVITGNGRRKRVTWVWWPLLQSLFLRDGVSCCGTWQLPPTGLHRALCCGSACPALPGAKEKHMAGATPPAQQCQEQKPGCYKPCPQKSPFHTSINFKEREGRRRRGAFALLSLTKHNQSGERVLCFQADIPSMCLAR